GLANALASTQIYPLSLHDALPISEIIASSADCHHATSSSEVTWSDVTPRVWKSCSSSSNPCSVSWSMTMVRSGRVCRVWESATRSEEHTSELQSRFDIVCRRLRDK